MSEFSDRVFESLKVTEGYVPTIYSDQLGIPTFGLGYALVVYDDVPEGEEPAGEKKWQIRSDIELFFKKITNHTVSKEDIMKKLQKAADQLNQHLTPAEFVSAATLLNPDNADILAQEKGKYGSLSVEAFKTNLWDAEGQGEYKNLFEEYQSYAVNDVGQAIWDKLSVNERTALFSIRYNAKSLIDEKMKNALKLLTANGTMSADVETAAMTDAQYVGKTGFLFEIIYGSITLGTRGQARVDLQRRRFF